MRHWIYLLFLLPLPVAGQISKDSASFMIKEIYRQSYTELKSYEWLTTLTKDIGPRLSGSEGADKSVQWTKSVLDSMGLDSVWLQEIMVPHWVRGENEQVLAIGKHIRVLNFNALALGNSPGSGIDGVRGEILEVQTLDELREMHDSVVSGKVVFFNRPMDVGLPSTFSAYGGAGDQRVHGPAVAAEKGAVGVVSHNVIGEIRGSEFPDEIILVGGHLDSWDVGEGAHDDGAGCMHAMEVLYRMKKLGYRPKRTIRCVLFMNEENGLSGGLKYAQEAIANDEYHLVALESDGGGHTPQGFGCSAGDNVQLDVHLAYMADYFSLLEPYYLQLQAGGGGADIGPLRPKAGLLIGLRPDNARYFDYHHAETDVLENVHPRELASGAAAITSFIFLIDQYGIGR